MLLFKTDPAKTIGKLSSLETVITGGKLYRIADIERARLNPAWPISRRCR
jgi:hypothetical protein